MAGLRQRRLAGDVALNWLYQDRHLGWLALVFASDRPEQVDRQITHWLQALQQTTPEQQQHYYQLSRRRFQALSPLDQLRQRAFGFAPGAPPAGFADFCAALQAAPTVSLACQTISPGSLLPPRALACRLAAGAAARSLTRRWRSLFIRRPLAISLPKPGESRAAAPPPVTGRAAEAPAATALLLLARSGRRAGEQLRPLLAALRHAGGHGEWHLFDGSWQLILQLPASGQRPEAILQAIVRQLALPVAPLTPPPESIAIRHLMAQLPERLGTSGHQEGWLAALAGGSAEDAQWVARQLSLLTARLIRRCPLRRPAAAASNGWFIRGRYGAAGLYSAAGRRLAGGPAGAGAAL
jgi:hypothetical protein